MLSARAKGFGVVNFFILLLLLSRGWSVSRRACLRSMGSSSRLCSEFLLVPMPLHSLFLLLFVQDEVTKLLSFLFVVSVLKSLSSLEGTFVLLVLLLQKPCSSGVVVIPLHRYLGFLLHVACGASTRCGEATGARCWRFLITMVIAGRVSCWTRALGTFVKFRAQATEHRLRRWDRQIFQAIGFFPCLKRCRWRDLRVREVDMVMAILRRLVCLGGLIRNIILLISGLA